MLNFANKKKFLLSLSHPASSCDGWLSALPSGNGKTGILVQGGVRYERIMITSASSLWKGEVGVLPDISDRIKDVRRNIDSKNPTHASTILSEALSKREYKPVSPALLPICDLKIQQNVGTKPISSYLRVLDMQTGEVSVSFNDSGTKCQRNCFVSKQANCIVYQLEKSSGTRKLSIELSLVEHDKSTAFFDETLSQPFKSKNQEIETDFLTFSYSTEKLSAGVVARVIVDQKAIISFSNKIMKIDEAEKIIVILAPFVGNKDRIIPMMKSELLKLKNISYSEMLSEHSKLFSKEWDKSYFSIADEKEQNIDKLMSEFSQSNSKLLYEKLFHYARFLTICGLENEFASLCPSALWSFHYQNNKSVANLSSSVPTFVQTALKLGMEQKVEFLFDYFEKYSGDFKKNAIRIYKSKGFMLPNKLAFDSGLTASIQPADLSFVAGGAIVANLFYDYFEHTRDVKFLKNRAIPFMLEVADFYLSFFQIDSNGKLRSCPSFSPGGVKKDFEHRPIGIYENCTCDFVIVRALITNILSASEKYKIEIPNIDFLSSFLVALPAIKLENGMVTEYLTGANSLRSSGVLHLYPVFGSHEISAASPDKIVAAFLNVVISKITSGLFYQDASSLGKLAEVASLLGQGDASLEIINYLISSFVQENLIFQNYDLTNTGAVVGGEQYFNINVNQSIALSISSFLVQSSSDSIHLLPALPKNWNKGEIVGIGTRCGACVDLNWDFKKGYLLVKIKANRSTVFDLILPPSVKKVKDFEFNTSNMRLENLSLTGGKTASFEIKL